LTRHGTIPSQLSFGARGRPRPYSRARCSKYAVGAELAIMMGSRSSPVILTYHSISEGRSPLCTSPGLFAWQMEWLKARGQHVIPLAELASALRGEQVFPPRSIVLTFDDGFRDFREAAYPVLMRCGFPSTV